MMTLASRALGSLKVGIIVKERKLLNILLIIWTLHYKVSIDIIRKKVATISFV